MCGIAGFLDAARSRDDEDLAALATAMAAAIEYRGPDGNGLWTDPAAGVALHIAASQWWTSARPARSR